MPKISLQLREISIKSVISIMAIINSWIVDTGTQTQHGHVEPTNTATKSDITSQKHTPSAKRCNWLGIVSFTQQKAKRSQLLS